MTRVIPACPPNRDQSAFIDGSSLGTRAARTRRRSASVTDTVPAAPRSRTSIAVSSLESEAEFIGSVASSLEASAPVRRSSTAIPTSAPRRVTVASAASTAACTGDVSATGTATGGGSGAGAATGVGAGATCSVSTAGSSSGTSIGPPTTSTTSAAIEDRRAGRPPVARGAGGPEHPAARRWGCGASSGCARHGPR